MGLFGELFGTAKSSSYTSDTFMLSEKEVRDWVISRHRMSSLTPVEEKLIEDAILGARYNGRVSMRKINEVLGKLYTSRKISLNDKNAVLKACDAYIKRRKK